MFTSYQRLRVEAASKMALPLVEKCGKNLAVLRRISYRFVHYLTRRVAVCKIELWWLALKNKEMFNIIKCMLCAAVRHCTCRH